MKKFILILVVALTGCSTMSAGPAFDGRPQVSWVLKDHDGCKDRIGLWHGKLMYSRCF